MTYVYILHDFTHMSAPLGIYPSMKELKKAAYKFAKENDLEIDNDLYALKVEMGKLYEGGIFPEARDDNTLVLMDPPLTKGTKK